MGLSPDQRDYMMRTLRGAIATFYGDKVPDLKTFTNQKRKTFIAKLEELVDAAGWRAKIAAAVDEFGRAKAAQTVVSNNYQVKKTEIVARQSKEMEELRAKQAKELVELDAHYAPSTLEAKNKANEKSDALDAARRASYFAAIGQEDDGRRIYGEYAVDEGIKQRVDDFISAHLMDDDDGRAVQVRIHQETIISDLVYISKDMLDLRARVLAFIALGKLPALTVEAWLIEGGQDLTPAPAK